VRPVLAFWRWYGRRLAERQAQLWLYLVYVGVVGPTWLVARLARRSLFPHARVDGSHWIERAPLQHSLAEMRRMG
jgi:hypothetical protein